MLNIRLRVNWFVEPELQTNFLENLYLKFKTRKPFSPISPEEIAALKSKKVHVIIHNMGIDLNSDAGELLVTIMSKVAELERKKILARTQAGREAAKKYDKWLDIAVDHLIR